MCPFVGEFYSSKSHIPIIIRDQIGHHEEDEVQRVESEKEPLAEQRARVASSPTDRALGGGDGVDLLRMHNTEP